jgi:hypothetical protein
MADREFKVGDLVRRKPLIRTNSYPHYDGKPFKIVRIRFPYVYGPNSYCHEIKSAMGQDVTNIELVKPSIENKEQYLFGFKESGFTRDRIITPVNYFYPTEEEAKLGGARYRTQRGLSSVCKNLPMVILKVVSEQEAKEVTTTEFNWKD